MGKISVVLSVVDEEVLKLKDFLASAEKYASEIVILDHTSGVLSGFGPKVKIFKEEIPKFVELVRNLAVSKAKSDWILILDPDELVGEKLARKLLKIADRPSADYYRLPRKNIIFGKWIRHSRWWPDYNIRFFKKGFVSWSEIIHKIPTTQGKGLDLLATPDNAIIHNNYSSVSEFISRMDRYTSSQAESVFRGGHKFSWTDLVEKPTNEFLSRYFSGEGYKDGLHGFSLAILQAVSELILYLKVWEKEKFAEGEINPDKLVREYERSLRKIKWWTLDTKIQKSNYISSLLLRIYRKIFLRNE